MSKKGYRKPKIEKVKLVAQEAVLTVCKRDGFQGGPNPSFLGCNTPGDPNGCMIKGS